MTASSCKLTEEEFAAEWPPALPLSLKSVSGNLQVLKMSGVTRDAVLTPTIAFEALSGPVVALKGRARFLTTGDVYPALRVATSLSIDLLPGTRLPIDVTFEVMRIDDRSTFKVRYGVTPLFAVELHEHAVVDILRCLSEADALVEHNVEVSLKFLVGLRETTPLSALVTESTCVICLERPPEYVNTVCKHGVLCAKCVLKHYVGSSTSSCPICRNAAGAWERFREPPSDSIKTSAV